MASNILGQALLALGFFSAFVVCLVTYRLYFSSLAKFPGPKLAAATSLYSFFYDVIQGGQYVWVIEDMHKKYGPIVRIRPDLLHINDPQGLDLVFGTAGKRRDKYKIAVNGFATPGASLGTTHHDLHRSRRAALNPYFSKQSIRRLEPILQRTLTKVLGRLSQAAKSDEPMEMNLLFKATTSDIISDYCFGQSSNNLDREDLNEPFFTPFTEAGKGIHFSSFNPWLVPLMTSLPVSITLFIMPKTEVFINLLQDLTQKIEGVKEATKNKAGDKMAPTIFHGLLTNGNLPESEKSTSRLLDEARVLLAGGTDTTANTLAALTYHLLSNPEILKKLKVELSKAVPDPESTLELSQLEALPYLTAVIEEGIRLHPGASVRQDRVAPDEDLFFEDLKTGKKYVIPRGTAIGMTAPLLSKNEEIYPSPTTFNPDRFLENPRLDRYQLSFSRGSRRCIGINLAYSELYLMLAGIFRKYDLYDGTGKQTCPTLELFETGREDVDMAADFVSPFLKEGSLGVRARVR